MAAAAVAVSVICLFPSLSLVIRIASKSLRDCVQQHNATQINQRWTISLSSVPKRNGLWSMVWWHHYSQHVMMKANSCHCHSIKWLTQSSWKWEKKDVKRWSALLHIDIYAWSAIVTTMNSPFECIVLCCVIATVTQNQVVCMILYKLMKSIDRNTRKESIFMEWVTLCVRIDLFAIRKLVR